LLLIVILIREVLLVLTFLVVLVCESMHFILAVRVLGFGWITEEEMVIIGVICHFWVRLLLVPPYKVTQSMITCLSHQR
jgi:hypothetical protein